MITVKKNAIKYKSSDGTMKDSGVLCQIGTFGEDYARYASAISFVDDNLPNKVILNLDKATKLDNMFIDCSNLEEITINCPNKITSMGRFIYASKYYDKIKKVVFNVDTSETTNMSQCFYMLLGNKDVEIIGELDFTSATNVNGMFYLSFGLKEVRFKKETLKISLSMDACSSLSDTSIQSIIDGLADLTGSTAQTLTLHATVKAKLTDDQIAQITSKNWTLA